MEIEVVKTYDPPAIPGWFKPQFERILPTGVLRWNWQTEMWEVWRKRPDSNYTLSGNVLTRWSFEDGRRKPLNQELLDHIQKSYQQGVQATLDVLDEIDRLNEQYIENSCQVSADMITENFWKKHDLSTNKVGGCRVGFSRSYGYVDLKE